jgi:NitT/TauT family transport system permease protein
MGVIRAVKGVVIGQLLVSVVGFGRMFETYSRIFLMEEFWALTLVLFVFALGGAALIERLERRVEYYAGARH